MTADEKTLIAEKKLGSIRFRMHEIIFEADTFWGKFFDVALLVIILSSIMAVMFESVEEIVSKHAILLKRLEWFFTVIFSIEYLARIFSVLKPTKYIFSFFGIIDFLAVIPTYLSLFFTGSHFLVVIRIVRLLRIFRIFKLARYLGEADILMKAMRASRYKVTVFLEVVLVLVIILGTIMYLIEGPENGFTSIPRSIYWAIVTLTTVGYGDIAPHTVAGQTLASFVMIIGYGIIAVPTGIVTAELAKIKDQEKITTQSCPHCLAEGHDKDALFCKYCGNELNSVSDN